MTMDTITVITVVFYVIVFIGLVQIDRRLYDIVRTLEAMSERSGG